MAFCQEWCILVYDLFMIYFFARYGFEKLEVFPEGLYLLNHGSIHTSVSHFFSSVPPGEAIWTHSNDIKYKTSLTVICYLRDLCE